MEAEKQEKTENELIAEFMGIVFWKQIQGQKYYKVPKEHVYVNNAGLGQFRYDRSWDWLMPVVEKINDLGYNGSVRPESKVYKIIDLPIITPIDKVYKAVIEFIKWYNAQGSASNSTSE